MENFKVYCKNDILSIMNNVVWMANDDLTSNRVENNSFTTYRCHELENKICKSYLEHAERKYLYFR